ncbi:hypothetical protein V6N13_073947 [Hibiscus sabdariffa]|uniref:WRKY domain-containing protein n=1 Tax=Hibiscus sabdariffa TaxID=183260 RepID=A0ABR2U766_9ROSI
MGEWEQRNLINELTQGRELARQLQAYLNSPSSSNENRELLVLKIQASYQKALSMLNCNTSLSTDQPQSSELALGMSESPPSHSVSPRSEDSDRDFKEPDKKRKALPRWARQVKVTPGTALEEPLDDGFSWRKYGQKDILGAKYPRGYYRCTHRNVQGCLARKQVQRSDEDPTIIEITYRGTHTCNVALASRAVSENQEQQTQKQSQDLLLSFRRELEVITHDLDIGDQAYPSFPGYPSNMKVENSLVFSPPVMGNNNFAENLSSSRMNSDHLLGNVDFPNSEPRQLTAIYQTAASSTNSPTVGLDFPFGGADEFHPNFTFDNNGFFS